MRPGSSHGHYGGVVHTLEEMDQEGSIHYAGDASVHSRNSFHTRGDIIRKLREMGMVYDVLCVKNVLPSCPLPLSSLLPSLITSLFFFQTYFLVF